MASLCFIWRDDRNRDVWSLGPLVATISRWFEKQRGLAIGIGSIGGGIGTLFYAPLTEYLIQEFGWRLAY